MACNWSEVVAELHGAIKYDQPQKLRQLLFTAADTIEAIEFERKSLEKEVQTLRNMVLARGLVDA
jgi:hypothetical protein